VELYIELFYAIIPILFPRFCCSANLCHFSVNSRCMLKVKFAIYHRDWLIGTYAYRLAAARKYVLIICMHLLVVINVY